MTDGELVRRALDGDAAAYDELARREEDRLDQYERAEHFRTAQRRAQGDDRPNRVPHADHRRCLGCKKLK